MKRPAVFFDRDNTLIVGSDYLGDPDDVVLMNGAADAVSRAKALGYATVVVSNQSGVARGMFTEADVRAVNTRVEEYLREENENAVIDRQEFCPFHPDAPVEKYRRDSDLRKPKPGMFLKAAEILGLDLSRSWVIGDAPRDIEAGKAAGCKTILFKPQGIEASPAADEPLQGQPDFTCNTLLEAIDYIARHDEEQKKTAAPVKADPAAVSNNGSTKSSDAPSSRRIESLLEQVLQEVRHRSDRRLDFSVSKLMAGITQILAIAVLFVAYLNRANTETMFALTFAAMFIQLLTIALLIMDRQR
jgi:D-glycero-D-manno-heptose 1,7-bisphosphate phosphatase